MHLKRSLLLPSHSSNLYTVDVTSTSKKKRSGLVTTALALSAIAGAVGIESMLNPGVPIFGDPTSDVAAPSANETSTPGATASQSAEPSASASATPTKTAASAKSATGNAIQYRYGVVQVKVTKKGGTITAVSTVQGTATAGRQTAFSYLEQYAVSANGTGFSNLSGATFTTDAFKQALDSALNKLG